MAPEVSQQAMFPPRTEQAATSSEKDPDQQKITSHKMELLTNNILLRKPDTSLKSLNTKKRRISDSNRSRRLCSLKWGISKKCSKIRDL